MYYRGVEMKEKFTKTNMENLNHNEQIQTYRKQYYEMFSDMPEILDNYIITDCLSKSHFELRPDLKERLIKEGIKKCDNNNGRTVFPIEVNKPINILLNRKYIIETTFDGTLSWIGTFAHELTHAIDYYQMALKENLFVYDPLLEQESKYFIFQIWSEYHAKRIGYLFLRNYLKVDNDDTTKNDRIEYILETELPYHIKQHYNDYHNAHDMVKEINLTMFLLGRLSVWCDLFPDIFNKSFINSKFEGAPWIFHIFQFLQQCNKFEKVYLKFDELKQVLKENWEGI